jgi:hypothetical protein
MDQDNTVTTQTQPPIEHVRQKFETWRKSRDKRRPIPNALWDAAIQLHGEYGICQISKALRLNYSDLKRRILTASEKKADPSPAFIQFDFARQTAQSEWSVELENKDGTKLKISAKSSSLPDVMQLSHNFLRNY